MMLDPASISKWFTWKILPQSISVISIRRDVFDDDADEEEEEDAGGTGVVDDEVDRAGEGAACAC